MRKNIKPVKTKVKTYERVRSAMVEAGYTQEALARAVGIGKSTLNQKLNGKRVFTLPESILISEALGKTLNDIFMPNESRKWDFIRREA
jgi:DNA-binding XRE family transcriptional regulator